SLPFLSPSTRYTLSLPDALPVFDHPVHDAEAGLVERGRDSAHRLLRLPPLPAPAAHGSVEQLARVAQAERDRVRADVLEPHGDRSEEHTSKLQSREKLVCRLLLE